MGATVRTLGPNALPADAWPPCGHGHEVTELRRKPEGTYRARCDLCGAFGLVVPLDELTARHWRLDDVFDEGQE
jgi:hypothetical protein